MNTIRLYNADALIELKNIPENSVDLIIADPPYNLGKDYGNSKDKKEFEEYLCFTRSWLKEAERVLTDKGTIYVFMGFRFISYLFSIMEREMSLLFNSWIVWHYTQGIGKTKGFSPRHDDILMFTKTTSFIFNLDNIRVPQKYYRQRNNMRGANPGDVWEFSHVHYCNKNRFEHPTQKPEGLIERMVLASSDEDSTVLDPFAGSGTTLRVCQQLKRKVIGIELNPMYCQMIQNRLETEFTGFDSIDPRMERIPKDLHDKKKRSEYLEQHKKWFLNNHEDSINNIEHKALEEYKKENDKSVVSLF